MKEEKGKRAGREKEKKREKKRIEKKKKPAVKERKVKSPVKRGGKKEKAKRAETESKRRSRPVKDKAEKKGKKSRIKLKKEKKGRKVREENEQEKKEIPSLNAAPILNEKEEKKEKGKDKQEKKEGGIEKTPLQFAEKKRDIIIDEKEKKRLLEKYKPNGLLEKPRNKDLIEVKDLDSLLKKIKNEAAVYILEYLRKKNPALAEKLFLGKTFESDTQLERYLMEETAKVFVSEAESLKGRVSELRKKGGDANYLDFSIMQIPLKIKVFSASLERKDFDIVLVLLEKANKEVKDAENAASSNTHLEEQQ